MSFFFKSYTYDSLEILVGSLLCWLVDARSFRWSHPRFFFFVGMLGSVVFLFLLGPCIIRVVTKQSSRVAAVWVSHAATVCLGIKCRQDKMPLCEFMQPLKSRDINMHSLASCNVWRCLNLAWLGELYNPVTLAGTNYPAFALTTYAIALPFQEELEKWIHGSSSCPPSRLWP